MQYNELKLPSWFGMGTNEFRHERPVERMTTHSFNMYFRCSEVGCDSLVRPHVVWFHEALEDEVLEKTHEALRKCDVCLLVSNSTNRLIPSIV